MTSLLRSLQALVLILLLNSCVKIQTGQSLDEAVESNEIRAKEIRIQWRAELDRTSDDKDRALLVKNRIDSTAATIIRYGFNVAGEWHKGNDGRGAPIEASEMRQVVNSWVAAQKPYLMAFEDNIEYGIRLVGETRKYGRFSEEAYNLFDSLASQYYNTYSSVFYPNDNVSSYEENLFSAQSRHRELSDRLERLLR